MVVALSEEEGGKIFGGKIFTDLRTPTSGSLAPGVKGCIPTMWCCLTTGLKALR